MPRYLPPLSLLISVDDLPSSLGFLENGFRWYRNQKWDFEDQIAKCFLVKFETARVPLQGTPITSIEFTNDSPNINLQYEHTLRLYPSVQLAAAMIGALIKFNNNVISTGFAYKDASCYPSKLHVNGESVDIAYQNTTQLNVNFIKALHAFGFTKFRIGKIGHTISNRIYNHSDFSQIRNIFIRDLSGTLHSTHLHSEKVILKDGIKTL